MFYAHNLRTKSNQEKKKKKRAIHFRNLPHPSSSCSYQESLLMMATYPPSIRSTRCLNSELANSPALSCLHRFSSVVQSCLTLCDPMDYSTPGFPVHHQLPELAQTHIHQVGDALQPSHPLLPLLLLPSIFPSIRVFFNDSVLHIRQPKYHILASASVLPMNIQD